MVEEFHTLRGYQLLEQGEDSLTHAMEDYLEMICRLCAEDGYTRVNILAESLNVQAPSATKMLQRLAEAGLVDYQRYGIVHLTGKGKKIGSYLVERHNTVAEFLQNLGLEDVLKDTEKMEHSLSQGALERLQLVNKFLRQHPHFQEQLTQFMLSSTQKKP